MRDHGIVVGGLDDLAGRRKSRIDIADIERAVAADPLLAVLRRGRNWAEESFEASLSSQSTFSAALALNAAQVDL